MIEEADNSPEMPPAVEYDNFFPRHILRALAETAQTQIERKRIYVFSDVRRIERGSMPDGVMQAAHFVHDELDHDVNTAILKRYFDRENYHSRAYDFHEDPVEYHRDPLFLATIDGEAVLEVKIDGGFAPSRVIECQPNTAVVIDPRLEHRVTPPKNADGVRHFLFLGHNYTLEEVL